MTPFPGGHQHHRSCTGGRSGPGDVDYSKTLIVTPQFLNVISRAPLEASENCTRRFQAPQSKERSFMRLNSTSTPHVFSLILINAVSIVSPCVILQRRFLREASILKGPTVKFTCSASDDCDTGLS